MQPKDLTTYNNCDGVDKDPYILIIGWFRRSYWSPVKHYYTAIELLAMRVW